MQIAKEKILIADGEETIREMVSRIVNQSGFEAVTVKQAKQALEVLKSMPFILLIADLKLPGMGGLELIKAARSENPDLHAICMTDSLQDYIDLIASGASDYITKPFTVGEMKAKLDRVNRERSLIRDLTQKSVELERLNEELKRLDQLKSTFISSISHELRTPLTVIKEFVSLMIEGHVGPVTDDQKEYLGIANKNVLRLTNLIETLLDFSRIESGKRLKLRFEPVRLIEVVEDAAMTIS